MFIFQQNLDESKNDYLRRHKGEADLDAVVQLFWDIVRKRVKAPQNDIDWWMKKPYEDFRRFVMSYDTRNKSQRRHDAHSKKAEEYGAKFIMKRSGWEVWYVPSYEAARELGRFYAGHSASWCISTENPYYFNDMYGSSEFMFLIWTDDAEKCPYEAWTKLAVQNQGNGQYELWDINDHECSGDQEYLNSGELIDFVEEDLLPDFRNLAGTDREEFSEKLNEKYASDVEWLKQNAFSDASEVTLLPDGSVTCNLPFDCIDDVTDETGDIDFDFVKDLIYGDDFDLFNIDYDAVTMDCEPAATEFNRIKPAGLIWSDIIDIANGNVPDRLNTHNEVIGWIRQALEDDFYEGNGYATVYIDAMRNGICGEARDDIERQIKSAFFVEKIEYGQHTPVLKCHFSKDDVMRAVRGYSYSSDGNPIANARYDDGELDRYTFGAPTYGWDGFDDGYMKEAAKSFAKRLEGFAKKQKDSSNQTYFDFDKDMITNPDNLSERKRMTFGEFLAEANAAGSDFEQKTAKMINEWLKSNGMSKRFCAKRYQSVNESRDEDFSDIVIEDLNTGKSFFVECKNADRANVLNLKLDISEDGKLFTAGKTANEAERKYSDLIHNMQECDDFCKFWKFMISGNSLIGGAKPADYYFGEKDPDKILPSLLKKYNQLVKDGKTEADCKTFGKKLRDSTKGQLVAALCWRLTDPDSTTWDICKIDNVHDFGQMIRGHYASEKEIPVAYIQFNDKLFTVNDGFNPLGLVDVPEFPSDVVGKFAIKFTPRFGTGSIYVTSRSEITSDFDSKFSFNDKNRWPNAGKKTII